MAFGVKIETSVWTTGDLYSKKSPTIVGLLKSIRCAAFLGT